MSETTQWKNKSREELLKALTEKRDAWRAIRFGATGSKSADVKAVKNLRREIASIMARLADESGQATQVS
ncbi:MAG: 50S ribosomal protein L29 [Patescibacteria group bacterium]|nr:50S ribosomal protein L29 [Patescibacteria group bacterium]